MKYIFTMIVTMSLFINAMGQDKGVWSGNFQSNFSVFMLDSAIGAFESPQYFTQISSSEAWLFLNYKIKGFDFAARYDLFNNSNLLNPTGSFSGHGIGFWQIKKSIDNLTLTVGSFYDQFGSGLIFRAFENRLIGIDYAVEGVHAKYQINDHFFVKAFTGNQKGSQENRFGSSSQIVKGINSEHSFEVNEGRGTVTFGASGVNRTLSGSVMSEVVAEIESYNYLDRFDPKYNVYAYNLYMNGYVGNFNFGAEYNQKSPEAIRDQLGLLVLKPGSIFYANVGYSKNKLGKSKKGGIGVNVQYRHIDHFQLKTSPNDQLLNGILSYQPSLTRQASYRMLARYQAPAQDYGEKGLQAEVIWTINKGKTLTLNYSIIQRLDGEQLYYEYYGDYQQKFSSKLKATVGLQSIFYNQEIYEGKDPSYHDVHTITPFVEATYKITRRNSIRCEAQYLMTGEDLGSFVNAIIELNLSPHYSFSFSDMVNVDPVRHAGSAISDDIVHYWTIFGKYNINTTSFTLAYIKQVQGINCTGGICRIEPAFSGVRFTLTTNF
jgi:hypothetical protein